MSITIKHLSKHYGTQKAVDDISFQVNKGEIVGFWAQMAQENPLQ